MPLSLAEKLQRVGMAGEPAKLIQTAINENGQPPAVTSDDVSVPEITAANFTFAGGTLTEFCQAIADAIPAPAA